MFLMEEDITATALCSIVGSTANHVSKARKTAILFQKDPTDRYTQASCLTLSG